MSVLIEQPVDIKRDLFVTAARTALGATYRFKEEHKKIAQDGRLLKTNCFTLIWWILQHLDLMEVNCRYDTILSLGHPVRTIDDALPADMVIRPPTDEHKWKHMGVLATDASTGRPSVIHASYNHGRVVEQSLALFMQGLKPVAFRRLVA